MHKTLLLLLLMAGLCLQQQALSQTTNKAPQGPPSFDTSAAPNDALTAALKKMLQQTNVLDVAYATMDGMMKQQKAANTDAASQAFFEKFIAAYKTNRIRNIFENMFIKIYRRHFNQAEVEELIKFYETPLGKKTLVSLPAIMIDSQTEGSKLGQLVATEVLAQMEAEGNN